MKSFAIKLVFLIFILLFMGCSKEEIRLSEMEYTGTIIGFDGCNSSKKLGLYYKIRIENDDQLSYIRTNTLPDSIAQKGLSIAFKIKETEDSSQICLQNIKPPFNFYDIYDISLIP